MLFYILAIYHSLAKFYHGIEEAYGLGILQVVQRDVGMMSASFEMEN